jgi:hypothetical protein
VSFVCALQGEDANCFCLKGHRKRYSFAATSDETECRTGLI